MSLNKYIHPRNPYKKPPDFKELALEYPEFRKFIEQDLSGRVRYDFKKEGAVKELTKTLLHKDFKLNVEFPPDRLVPTLTLRLNYLLWMEDMLKCFADMNTIFGIDIGTGASCIYPLLSARHFKWKMLATEIDPKSVQFANENVLKNNLDDMITVKEVNKDQFLVGVINDEQDYDFCICNPPFFCDDSDLDMFSKSRTAERNPPRNVQTGSMGELIASGGEISFVEKIIADSKTLGPKIRLYSVMMGHKKSVSKVKDLIEKVNPVRIEVGEFCQGRTMRWGIAWTFDPKLKDVVFPGSPKKMATAREKPPYEWFCQLDCSIESVVSKLTNVLQPLKIEVTVDELYEQEAVMTLTASENTWSHSRRKKREEKRKQLMANQSAAEDVKNVLQPENSSNVISSSSDNAVITSTADSSSGQDSLKRKLSEDNDQSNDITSSESSKFESGDSQPIKKPKSIYVECTLTVIFIEGLVSFALHYDSGIGGREAANQVLLYIKNHLK